MGLTVIALHDDKPQEVFQSVERGKFVFLFASPDDFNQWLFGGRCGRSSPSNSSRSVITIWPAFVAFDDNTRKDLPRFVVDYLSHLVFSSTSGRSV